MNSQRLRYRYAAHSGTQAPGPGQHAAADSKVPRPSSSQSLAPSRSDSDGRRTLLLVYIHGFYGNDQSFQSFPAHVHNVLREALSETHAVYSKVYPRYKTYKSIEVASENFSAWLEPHESPTTDVILIGHSMGGLLAAEVILTPNRISSSRQPLRHRILGSLSLDSPFLGLHPGIVASGISSLFHPSPTPSSQDAASSPPADLGPSSPASISDIQNGPRDPNFDPPYFNDSPFREQPFLARMLNFGSKHWSEGIFSALGNHVAAHLEFGGCLADYPGLKSRYSQLRALEDVDDFQALNSTSSNSSRNRVRFLNYYTLSPGRPKRPATAKGSRDTSQVDLSAEPAPEIKIEDEINDKLVNAIISAKLEDEEKNQVDASLSKVETPVQNNDDDLNETATTPLGAKEDGSLSNDDSIAKQEELKEQSIDMNRLSMQSMQSMQNIDPIPIDEAEHNPTQQESEKPAPIISDIPPSCPSAEDKANEKNESEINPSENNLPLPNMDLPPIPDLPNPPDQPDLSQYTDKDSRKQAEKEFSRRQKAYEQAAKDRNKALREREKLLEKLHKKAQKEAQRDADRLEKDTKKQQQKSEQDKRRLEKEEEKASKAEKKRLEKEATKQQLADETKTSSAAAASSTSSLTASVVASPCAETQAETPGGKPKKLGKFCTTPSKTNGAMDPMWVSVFMDGMDEVTAHCGLFFPGPHYDRLVGDVSGRIVSWVQDDLSVRAVLEMGPD
ncbi:hypothetical protein TRIATDRAFT_295509 [Trichoderma atroviride IMI 206040]|uniref:AB hydrolase-1 domain-containing protein n=1 Tax=Hypocrea atroviridis (strain ATCC 20476 / IMI 206040) TaxID=452589 RepID=G9P7Y4_HYPAI|nr:uncharacterized protein TRIATDRAFT_295509 [Trichoderma atroviride IMI 206040]EHK41671.1 hypothetical protein TRIATDRAFT_295509 [Trichoderma atroviride IMI 206040]